MYDGRSNIVRDYQPCINMDNFKNYPPPQKIRKIIIILNVNPNNTGVQNIGQIPTFLHKSKLLGTQGVTRALGKYFPSL